MKKLLIKLSIIFYLIFGVLNYSHAATNYLKEVSNDSKAVKKDIIKTKNENSYYFSKNGTGISKLAKNIANSLKSVFFIAAVVYFTIIALRLVMASNTEEEIGNFKKGIIWISIGILVINIASLFVEKIYRPISVESSNINSLNLGNYSTNLVQEIINPLIKLLELSAAFFFILVAIFAFYRLVTSNGNEENAKKGKMTIFYAVIGFILVKISSELVFAVYGNCDNNYSTIANILGTTCKNTSDLPKLVSIITSIINWLNSFVALVVIIMIIFSGSQIMFSNGDEEKLAKAKKSIIYIVIGIGILIFDYLILTFIL